MARYARKAPRGVTDAEVDALVADLRQQEVRGRGGRQPTRRPWTEIISHPDGSVEVIVSDEIPPWET